LELRKNYILLQYLNTLFMHNNLLHGNLIGKKQLELCAVYLSWKAQSKN